MEYNIELLEWDSNFFKKRVGRISIDSEGQLRDVNNRSAYDVIYVFSNNPELKLPLVDSKIVYMINDLQNVQDGTVSSVGVIELYDATKDSYSDLLSLALQSGEYSRFKLDSNFEENEYQKLYKEWLDQSIAKKLATDILVKRINKKVVGFAILAKKTENLADISLVAVDSEFRGRGIAKQLIQEAVALAKLQQYNKIQVVTQLDNNPANKLYKSVGFTEYSLTYIYHIWNYGTI